MIKKIFLFAGFVVLLLPWFFFDFRTKQYLAEYQLPVTHLDASNQNDADWVFETSVNGKTQRFIVYQWIVHALCSPEIVSIHLNDCDEQCWDSERMDCRYIGQTKEGIHILLATDARSWSRDTLLFVEVLKGEGVTLERHGKGERLTFYKDQVLLKKVGLIHLPTYCEPDLVSYDGQTIKIDQDLYSLDLTPPSQPELITGKLPFHFDRPPFVNPYFIDSFQSSMRTGGSVTIACDLEQAQKASKYDFLGNGLTSVYGTICRYNYEGKTKNGVHIVHSSYLACRPPQGKHLLFVFEKDYEITADWHAKKLTRNKERLLIKKVGELDLYYLRYFNIQEDTISYTDSFWENKPFAITGEMVEEEYVDEVKLKYVYQGEDGKSKKI